MLKFFSGVIVLIIGACLYLHYVQAVTIPFLPLTPEAAFTLGRNLTQTSCLPLDDDAENRERGMRALKFAAQNGHIEAAALYGSKLLETKDPEGLKWLERAAEQGQSESAFQLCSHFNSNISNLQDSAKILKWCRSAAEFGFVYSNIWLSEIYSKGLGVNPDIEEAYFWISLANYWSINKDSIGYSPEKMAEIAKLLTPERRKAIDDRVRKWSPKPRADIDIPDIVAHCEKKLTEEMKRQPVSDDIAAQCLKKCSLQLAPPDQRFLAVKDCPYWTYPHQDILVKRSTGEINTWP